MIHHRSSFMLIGWALITSMFAGYGWPRLLRDLVSSMKFALVIALSFSVVIDLEFPRLGLIRVDALIRC